MYDSLAGRSNKSLSIPETPKHAQDLGGTSTPPPSVDSMPQAAAPSAYVIHESGSDAAGEKKRKNVSASKNPKSKKGLHFSDDD